MIAPASGMDGSGILGASEGIKRALFLTGRFARTGLPILFVGATGTGKELFAREVHRRSGRTGPFIDVNCAALPNEMVESLLFGHRRGAYTGAHTEGVGLFEAAQGGTLFLDELGSLPVEAQGKLLRVLEAGELRRLGEVHPRRIDCRIVAASHEGLERCIRDGSLRMDLYQRLAGVVIRLPALGERPEDIVPLARLFAAEAGVILAPCAERTLLLRSWPGNVRELRTVVQRAAHLAGDGDGDVTSDAIVEATALAAQLLAADTEEGPTSGEATSLIALCRSHGWDVARAAAAVGVGRSTLYRRLQEAGVDPARWRAITTLTAPATQVDWVS